MSEKRAPALFRPADVAPAKVFYSFGYRLRAKALTASAPHVRGGAFLARPGQGAAAQRQADVRVPGRLAIGADGGDLPGTSGPLRSAEQASGVAGAGAASADISEQ